MDRISPISRRGFVGLAASSVALAPLAGHARAPRTGHRIPAPPQTPGWG